VIEPVEDLHRPPQAHQLIAMLCDCLADIRPKVIDAYGVASPDEIQTTTVNARLRRSVVEALKSLIVRHELPGELPGRAVRGPLFAAPGRAITRASPFVARAFVPPALVAPDVPALQSRPVHSKHLGVRPVQHGEATGDECRHTIRSDGELEARHSAP